jgi:hypothetical protein
MTLLRGENGVSFDLVTLVSCLLSRRICGPALFPPTCGTNATGLLAFRIRMQGRNGPVDGEVQVEVVTMMIEEATS